MAHSARKIVEVTPQRMEEVLERAASNTLRDEDMELLRQIFASYAGLFGLVGDRNTTIARLRKLMFGATTEKSKQVLGDATPDATPDAADDPANPSSAEASAACCLGRGLTSETRPA